MRPLISDALNAQLDKLVTKLFEGNRIADRGMTQLGVKFVMNKTESLLHPKLAHLFPALADKVSDYQSARNNLTFYGLTPADNTDYASPMDFFERMLQYMIDVEGMTGEILKMSADEEDFTTKAFLLRFYEDLQKVTNQCLLLVDKAEQYNGDWMAFDFRIDSWITL